MHQPDNSRLNKPFCNKWWISALVAIVIGAILFIVLIVTLPKAGDNLDYGIILDAGSSHTDMFIYNWPSAKLNETGEIHEMFRKECSAKGISAYADNLDDVEKTIQRCLDAAKEKIPADHYSKVPVFLGATAGMRLLNANNPLQSTAIFAKVKDTAMKYPFQFKDAKIISGEEEGAGAWITVNYLLQTFLNHSSTIGAMDLGGASTQIAFQPLSNLNAQSTVLQLHLFGYDYPLYAHSFLCYGKNEIEKRYTAMLVKEDKWDDVINDPCAPGGSMYTRRADELFEHVCTSSKYAEQAWGSNLSPETAVHPAKNYSFQGTADPVLCEKTVNKMFNLTCTASTCSYNNVYQPTVEGHFMAFSAFYYVMDFFNQTRDRNLTYLIASLQNYCKKSWSEVGPTEPDKGDKAKFQCFDGWYIKDMLTKGYGFTDQTWQNIQFTNKVNGQSTGWTTGIMLNLTNNVPGHAETPVVKNPSFLPLVICGSIFVVIAIILAVFAFYTRQKSQSDNMA